MAVPTVSGQWEPRHRFRLRSVVKRAIVVQINIDSRRLALAHSLPPSQTWSALPAYLLHLAAPIPLAQAHLLAHLPPPQGLFMAIAQHQPPCPHWTLVAARPNAAAAS